MKSTYFFITFLLIVLTTCSTPGNNKTDLKKVVKLPPTIDSLLISEKYNLGKSIEVGEIENLDFFNGYRGLQFGMSIDSIDFNTGVQRNDFYLSGKINIFTTPLAIRNNLLWGYINLTFYEDKLRIIIIRSFNDLASDKLIKMFGKPNSKSFFEGNRESFNRDYKKKNPTSPFLPEYINFDGEYSYSHYIWATEKIELNYSDTIRTSVGKSQLTSKYEVKDYYNSNLIISDLRYKDLISKLKMHIEDSIKKELKKKAEKEFIHGF